MKKIVFVACIVSTVIASDVGFLAGAEHGQNKQPSLKKTTNAAGLPIRTKMTINRISSWYDSDGTEEINSATGNSGLIFPRGTAGVIFTAGLMWTGIHNDGRTPALRTNGHSYNSGLGRGAILGIRTGQREDPSAADVRIWRIRRDYASADLAFGAAEINSVALNQVTQAQIDAVRAQYATDWMEWPAHKGAPFYDADGDGVYTPTIEGGQPVLFPDADEPGIGDAAQVIWYVANDLGVQQPWTNVETGMEMQGTIWGYARSDALGSVLFKKYRLIYKGIASTPANATITDMYLAQWSDPDIGVFGNDFAGCDTVLSLGFAYNGSPFDNQFADFNLAPPAAGYDFLQGPLVPGIAGQDLNKNGIDDAVDTGLFDLKITPPGFINLPMTAFVYFAAGGTYSDPPFTALGGIQWNAMLRGLPPTPQPPPDPEPPTDPFTGQPAGPFWLYAGSDGISDPINSTGWVDGVIDAPGDRRIILASGPFTMAVGDTQELVSAVVCGLGPDYLASVRSMKFNDSFVQTAYDSLFRLPGPPVPPKVSGIDLNNQVLIDWEFDSAAVAKTESLVVIGNYYFEGYKVYQFPSATGELENAVLLAQFDRVGFIALDPTSGDSVFSPFIIIQPVPDPITGQDIDQIVQYGTNNGIQKTFAVSTDAIRSGPLINGQEYFFGVSAYNFTVDELTLVKSYESPPAVVTVVPGSPKPGTRYPYSIGDTVQVLSRTPGNDASAYALIYNPTVQQGHEFKIEFDTTSSGNLVWSFKNEVTDDILFSDIDDLGGEAAYRVQANGFDLFVQDHPVALRTVTDASTGTDVFGPSSTHPDYAVLANMSPVDSTSSINGLGDTDRDFEIRFTTTGSYAVRIGSHPIVDPDRVAWVPFEVWDVGRTSEDSARQVTAAFPDSVLGGNSWDLTPNGVEQNGMLFSVFEPIGVTSIPYPGDSVDVHAIRISIRQAATFQLNERSALFECLIADKDGDGMIPAATTIRFTKYHETRHGDMFTMKLNSVTVGDLQTARDDVTAIKAFPNPYYGLNRAETTRERRFITFSHLPDRAVIRIFNLAGVLVRTLRKEDAPGTTQFLNWDLQNDSGLPVASGIYIAYMELKDAGGNDLGTKMLKLAIIQEQQFLRNF